MSLLLHALYVSALVGLVFPTGGPRYRLTCFLLLEAPHILIPLYRNSQEGLFPSRIWLLVLRERDRVSFSRSGWKCALYTTKTASKNLPATEHLLLLGYVLNRLA